MERISNRFALWLAIGRILSMLVSFAMPLILTRVLVQSDYGVFSQFFTLYMAFFVIFGLGFHSNLFYFYPTADENARDEYVSNTFFLLMTMSVVAVGVLSIPFMRDLLFGKGALREYSMLIVISIALAVPTNMISPLLTVREDKVGAVFYPPIAAILRVGAVVIAALIKNNLTVVFWALIIYQALIFLWILIYSFKNHRVRFSKKKLWPQVMYSIPFGLSVAIQLFTHYFDKIASIRFLDTVEYAIYATAFLSIPGINQIYESLCQVNVVNMSKGYQEGNLCQVRELYRDFVVKTLSFSTPVILAVSLFAEEVIGFLYPNEYIEAAYFFRIYSLTFLTAMLGAGTILRAIGKTQYSLVSYAVAALIGVPATYFLVKTYGIHGAIWGAVINMVLPRVMQMFYEAWQTESTILNYLDWKNIGFVLGWGVLFLAPLLAFKLVFHPSIWICILLSGLYVIVTYLVYVKKGLFLLSRETINRALRNLKR